MTRTHGTSKAPGAVAQLLAGQENLVEKIGLIVAQLQAIESGAAGSSQQQATMLASLNAQRRTARPPAQRPPAFQRTQHCPRLSAPRARDAWRPSCALA